MSVKLSEARVFEMIGRLHTENRELVALNEQLHGTLQSAQHEILTLQALVRDLTAELETRPAQKRARKAN